MEYWPRRLQRIGEVGALGPFDKLRAGKLRECGEGLLGEMDAALR